MSDIHLHSHGAVAELRLDNPDKLNALTVEMLKSLEDHCDTLENNPEVRAVLLTAEGDRAFCVGADINAWSKLTPFEFARRWIREGHRAFDRLANLSVPTIAVVDGPAFGGGLELLATCDLRVMSPTATLALPETGVGIVPGWSGTQRLAGQMPTALLKELAILGRRLTAERAYQSGFVNAVSDDARATAMEMAEEIVSRSPRATEITKYMIQAGLGMGTSGLIEMLGGGLVATTDDKSEGVTAFQEKRKPRFPGT